MMILIPFGSVQGRNDFAKFDITRKFKANDDTVTTDPFKTEGSIVIDDPAQFNQSEANLTSDRSPEFLLEPLVHSQAIIILGRKLEVPCKLKDTSFR